MAEMVYKCELYKYSVNGNLKNICRNEEFYG